MITMYSAKQAWCQAYQLSDSVDQLHSKAALIGYLWCKSIFCDLFREA